MCLYIHIYSQIEPAESVKVICMCAYRADHLALANPLVGSSLGGHLSCSQLTQLPIVLCVGMRAAGLFSLQSGMFDNVTFAQLTFG